MLLLNIYSWYHWKVCAGDTLYRITNGHLFAPLYYSRYSFQIFKKNLNTNSLIGWGQFTKIHVMSFNTRRYKIKWQGSKVYYNYFQTWGSNDIFLMHGRRTPGSVTSSPWYWESTRKCWTVSLGTTDKSFWTIVVFYSPIEMYIIVVTTWLRLYLFCLVNSLRLSDAYMRR